MYTEEINKITTELRFKLIEISSRNKIPHLGSCLSCIDILVVLYHSILKLSPKTVDCEFRDRFLLSKGHAANSLYMVLARYGYFNNELINLIGMVSCILEEHPGYGQIPGIENASGSLGHGLSLGTGIALSGRIQNIPYKTYVLMSDGECNEGSVWEAAMFAAKHKLENLIAIIDFNKWQATGRSCEIMALQPLKTKWEAFGWHAIEIDGHNIKEIQNTLTNTLHPHKPLAIIANTVKGKGISFMEDDNNWHYRIPTEEEVLLAKKELGVI